MALPTALDIATQYRLFVKNQNNALTPDVQGDDWYIQSFALGGIVAGAYADLYNSSLSMFPQTASLPALQKYLATWGLSQLQGAFPSQGLLAVQEFPPSDIVLPVGFQFNLPGGTLSWTVTEETTVPTSGTLPLIPLLCTVAGSGTQLAPGTILTPNTPVAGNIGFTVQSMLDGSDQENAASAASRVLQKIQFGPAGGTIGDYVRWAMTTPDITGARVFSNYGSQTIVGVFAFAGGFDVDTILASPDVFVNRTATPDQVSTVSDYIETQRPVTASFYVGSVTTYMIPASVINVQVRLVAGLTLVSQAPGLSFTIGDLIDREIRRAVVTTAPGGAFVGNTGYLTVSSIEQALDNGLSATGEVNGLYANILLDRTVTLAGGSPNFPLPSQLSVDVDGNIPIIYDVAYSSINLSLM